MAARGATPLLIAASVCDLRTREIPLSLTLTGTVLGLVGALLLPWPWPWTPSCSGWIR